MKSRIIASLFILALGPLASAASLFGVTDDNFLVSFETSAPSTFTSSVAISGLLASNGSTADPNARIINLSWQPSEGIFYGIDTNANFYRIGLNGSTQIVSNTFSPSGFDAGFSYDPISDKFVFGSDAAENISLSTSGAITTNSAFAYGVGDVNFGTTPSIYGVAFDPDFGTAYFLDLATGSLSVSYDIGLSELFTIGALGDAFTSYGDLTSDLDGNLFASLSKDGLTSELYSIDKTTGLATLAGGFGGAGVSALAVPEPSAALLGGLGLLVLARRRRA